MPFNIELDFGSFPLVVFQSMLRMPVDRAIVFNNPCVPFLVMGPVFLLVAMISDLAHPFRVSSMPFVFGSPSDEGCGLAFDVAE